MTSKYFPPQTPASKEPEMIRPCGTSGCPNRVRTGDARTSRPGSTADGRFCSPCRRRQNSRPSSPALRIACPVCTAPAGSYCLKNGRNEVQVIAHKKRREEEERTR